MKRKSAFLTFAACALMAAHSPARADDKKSPAPTASPAATGGAIERMLLEQSDFSNVQVITFKDSGNIGFFDRAGKKLYIYTPDLTKCIAIKQIPALGEPAKSLPVPSSPAS